MEKVSMSHEDYLEAIIMLGGSMEQSVRSVDIAKQLDVSKASVNKAIGLLKEKGFGARKPYGIIGMGLNYAFDKSVPNDCIAVLHLHNEQFNGLLKKRGS